MMNTNDIKQVLGDYYRDFSKLDVLAVLSYFHEPTVFAGSAGVFTIPTAEALRPVLSKIIEDLRARGYARSELIQQEIKLLSVSLALATGVAVRYRADGQEIERVGVTYLFYKSLGGWKIAVLAVHDPIP